MTGWEMTSIGDAIVIVIVVVIVVVEVGTVQSRQLSNDK